MPDAKDITAVYLEQHPKDDPVVCTADAFTGKNIDPNSPLIEALDLLIETGYTIYSVVVECTDDDDATPRRLVITCGRYSKTRGQVCHDAPDLSKAIVRVMECLQPVRTVAAPGEEGKRGLATTSKFQRINFSEKEPGDPEELRRLAMTPKKGSLKLDECKATDRFRIYFEDAFYQVYFRGIGNDIRLLYNHFKPIVAAYCPEADIRRFSMDTWKHTNWGEITLEHLEMHHTKRLGMKLLDEIQKLNRLAPVQPSGAVTILLDDEEEQAWMQGDFHNADVSRPTMNKLEKALDNTSQELYVPREDDYYQFTYGASPNGKTFRVTLTTNIKDIDGTDFEKSAALGTLPGVFDFHHRDMMEAMVNHLASINDAHRRKEENESPQPGVTDVLEEEEPMEQPTVSSAEVLAYIASEEVQHIPPETILEPIDGPLGIHIAENKNEKGNSTSFVIKKGPMSYLLYKNMRLPTNAIDQAFGRTVSIRRVRPGFSLRVGTIYSARPGVYEENKQTLLRLQTAVRAVAKRFNNAVIKDQQIEEGDASESSVGVVGISPETPWREPDDRWVALSARTRLVPSALAFPKFEQGRWRFTVNGTSSRCILAAINFLHESAAKSDTVAYWKHIFHRAIHVYSNVATWETDINTFIQGSATVAYLSFAKHARVLLYTKETKTVRLLDPWMPPDRIRRQEGYHMLEKWLQARGCTFSIYPSLQDQAFREGSCAVQALMRMLMAAREGIESIQKNEYKDLVSYAVLANYLVHRFRRS